MRAPRRFETYPRLRESHEADVAIVGGGLTGSTVAAVFGRAGLRVAVVEAALAGLGSTAANTALLLREPDLGLIELAAPYGASRLVWQQHHDVRISCRAHAARILQGVRSGDHGVFAFGRYRRR